MNKLLIKTLGWWFVALSSILLLDYLIRLGSGRMDSLGMAETSWFFSHFLLAFGMSIQFYINTRGYASLEKLVYLALLCTAAFVLYAVMTLLYVVGTGVDSL